MAALAAGVAALVSQPAQGIFDFTLLGFGKGDDADAEPGLALKPAPVHMFIFDKELK